MAWVSDRPDKSNPLGIALASGDVFYTIKQERQCESDTRSTSNEDRSIVVCEIWRFAIWTVNKHLHFSTLLSNIVQFLSEAAVDTNEKYELLPIGLGFTESLLGHLGNITQSFVTRGINTGDGEGVSLERDAGDTGHDQVSGLTRGPVEMRRPA